MLKPVVFFLFLIDHERNSTQLGTFGDSFVTAVLLKVNETHICHSLYMVCHLFHTINIKGLFTHIQL